MKRLLAFFLLLSTALPLAAAERSVFDKSNIHAWCVPPFDARHRTPEERAKMLKQLGIRHFAFDWREQDVPYWDDEIRSLKNEGIELRAWWLASGLQPAQDRWVNIVLDYLKRRGIKTQIWLMVGGSTEWNGLPQGQKVAQMAGAVRYIAEAAGKIGCKVGLYGHGGWFGDPENQLAIIRELKMDNVGIVYNFHHSYDQIDRFPKLLPEMQPYLYAINLNGMIAGSPTVKTIGTGQSEVPMMREILKSGYHGPIGIIHEQPELDAAIGLQRNLDGLKKVLVEIQDPAARTY